MWGKGFPGRMAHAKVLGIVVVVKDAGLSEKQRTVWLQFNEQRGLWHEMGPDSGGLRAPV